MFNPVTKMQLVELVFPSEASAETRRRALELCEKFEKTPVEVPDVPGFVVNRLLFPYLFSAVRLVEETGMDPADVDTCMRLGAGHPMGPLALLDLVGLDVSQAIGETIGEPVPARVQELIAEGRARPQERARNPRLLTSTLSQPRTSRRGRGRLFVTFIRLRRLLAVVHQPGDTGSCDIRSHRTPASSQCARSGPLPRGPDV